MWEAIRQNQRRSWVLIGVMGVILAALGVAIGTAVEPRIGGIIGAAAAIFLWLMLWLTALHGDRVLLSGSGARQISKQDAPQLWNVVEEMTIAAGLPKPPRVFVIDDDAPNAFAVGRNPQKACVAVTSGLLRRLNRDELQGVIAHEIGHVRNLDVRFMTLAAVMLGSIVLLSDIFLRSLFYGGGRRSSSRGGGQAQLVALLIAVALAIFGPIFAQLLYLACSRRREFLADASSARFTRYPAGLASALEKISQGVRGSKKVNRALAPLYIINPLQGASLINLFSTHPPTMVRVQILRSMAGAGLAEYERAYRRIVSDKEECIGAQTLESDTAVPLREASAEPDTPADATARSQEALDLIDRLANYLFIACACGVRIKVPPESPRDAVTCPRCGRTHAVPSAHAAPEAPAGPTVAEPPLRFERTGGKWETFRCRCRHAVQISPSFSGTTVRCPKCSRVIEVVTSSA
jgi:heat shock protein HtpX